MSRVHHRLGRIDGELLLIKKMVCVGSHHGLFPVDSLDPMFVHRRWNGGCAMFRNFRHEAGSYRTRFHTHIRHRRMLSFENVASATARPVLAEAGRDDGDLYVVAHFLVEHGAEDDVGIFMGRALDQR